MEITPALFDSTEFGESWPLTSREVAAELGVVPSTVWHWTQRGHLTPLRMLPGRRAGALYTRAEVDRVKALFRDGLRFAGPNARGRAS